MNLFMMIYNMKKYKTKLLFSNKFLLFICIFFNISCTKSVNDSNKMIENSNEIDETTIQRRLLTEPRENKIAEDFFNKLDFYISTNSIKSIYKDGDIVYVARKYKGKFFFEIEKIAGKYTSKYRITSVESQKICMLEIGVNNRILYSNGISPHCYVPKGRWTSFGTDREYVYITAGALGLEKKQSFTALDSSFNLEKISNDQTVLIMAEEHKGSGFFIKNNLIATNYHVVNELIYGEVNYFTNGGLSGTGSVVAIDKENDLAIIMTSKNIYKPLILGNLEKSKVGEDIYVVSSPDSLIGTVSKGIISAKRKQDLLQFTAAVSHGSSGSPVILKRNMHVIGIVVGSNKKGDSLNFAVSVNKLKILLHKNMDKIKKYELNLNRIKKLEKLAEKGDINIQYNLGDTYDSGKDIPRNFKKAVYWWKKAAKEGYKEAQYYLALEYDSGFLLNENPKKAAYWFKKAGDQGHEKAQLYLGDMYLTGKISSKDGGGKRAFYWWKKAADQGSIEGQSLVGGMYHTGGMFRSISKNISKAIYWYEKAANRGDVLSQYNLGNIYYHGKSISKNYKKSLYWYKKAAGQGLPFAQFSLGIMYHEGKGVSKNYKKALFWIKKAADGGNISAKKALKKLSSIK